MNNITQYSQPSRDIIKESEKLLITSASSPGWTSSVTSPSEIKISLGRIRDGVLGRSPTLALEGAVTLATNSFACIYGWITLSSYFSSACSVVSKLVNHPAATFSKVATVAQSIFRHPALRYSTFGIGMAIAGINCIFESIGLVKQLHMRSNLQFSDKIDAGNAQDKMATLLKYFELPGKESQPNKALMIKLGELVGPWLVQEISAEIHEQSDKINNGTDSDKAEAIEWLQKTYALIDIQSKKALITHTIGLVAILTDMLAGAISLIPAAWPLFLLVSALSLTLISARYVFYNGYFNSRGWVFRPENLIPVFVRENVEKAINALTNLKSKDIKVLDENKIDISYSALFLSFVGCVPGVAVPA